MNIKHCQEWYGKNITQLTRHKHYNLIYYQCNGTGTCIDYPLFPGINLIFMDFNCTDTFKETFPSRALLDIRHYQHGRVEFEFQNQKVFLVMDIENLRLHYNRTLLCWEKNYREHMEEVREMFDEKFVRMWDLYLSSCAATFHNGIIDLHQILLTNGINNDLPQVRWY